MGEKLKPCPFCGGEAKLHKDGFGCGYRVYCGKCFIRTECYESKETPIEKWNTRKPMERIVEQLEEEKSYSCSPQYNKAIDRAIKIVKRGGVDD